MNNKITLAKLSSELSAVTGCGEATSEQFLKVLIDEFSDTIAHGGTVRIDGIGELRADPSTHELMWTMDDELAAVLNEPFSAFEPVVLETGVTEEILAGAFDAEKEEIEKAESENVVEPIGTNSTPEFIQEATPETLPEVAEITEGAEKLELPEESPEVAESPEEPEESEKPAEHPEMPEVPESSELPDESYVYQKSRKRNPLISWIFFLIGLVAGLTIGYIAGLCCHPSSSSPEIAETVEDSVETRAPIAVVVPPDTVLEVEVNDSVSVDSVGTPEPVQKVEPVITDTVTASRYLTTLSRKYFGDFRFWIYIYEENKNNIDNPDRITPGTVVVIPSKEKYGIDSSNPESVRKAESLIREYYNSHKK